MYQIISGVMMTTLIWLCYFIVCLIAEVTGCKLKRCVFFISILLGGILAYVL